MRDEKSLEDIVAATNWVAELVKGILEAEFYGDQKTLLAVLYQIIVMGEAVKRLSMELRTRHAKIPWSDIAGMRDKLVHDYEEVIPYRILQTVTDSAPALTTSVFDVVELEAQRGQ
ncbi:MAG: DUF86 domain-containing protein [Cyanophyceae cyanobacterium]